MAPTIDVSEKDFERAKVLLNAGQINYQLPEVKQVADLDRSNWIVVPSEFIGSNYSFEVNPARISSSRAVQKAAIELSLNNYENTSKDSLGRDFVGNNNWSESLKLNLGLGCTTLNPMDLTHYANLLFRGMQEKANVYDVSGKKIDSKVLRSYFEDMFKVQSPWRAEWIDADFKTTGSKLYLNSNHTLDSNGNLITDISQPLAGDTLKKDKTPGICLEDWITNPTKQGLPKNSKGDLYYWAPDLDNNSVAGLDADSDRAGLNCGRDPSGRNSYLGVRAVKRRE